ncbi:sugar dehydrogenase complex small subunit [Bacillus thuringiensis]|uniref:sugar dehydrogenase complex small subunit n=1 Tax=Bacillus thuringiensis TaxID=1428 RepID=UPI000BF56BA0|nr:sugar dehydrogenase complex small subunit [Bacillus thuringiensis]PEY73216.1 hypothetical protein CN355_11280 [Bacillus thuringiensis]
MINNRSNLYDFYTLSTVLTGFNQFELLSTGIGEMYYKTIHDNTDEGVFRNLLQEWISIESEYTHNKTNQNSIIKNQIMHHPDFGPVARSIIMLWYTGCWSYNDKKTFVVDQESYKQGLMWKAIGAHSIGANPQGYGAWSLSPEGNAGRE